MEIAGVGLLFLVVGAIVLCLYFLPTIIGFLRNKMAIFALNFFSRLDTRWVGGFLGVVPDG